MRNFFISIILLLAITFNLNAQLANLKNIIEKPPVSAPFHILKKTAEKISSIGLKKLFWYYSRFDVK